MGWIIMFRVGCAMAVSGTIGFIATIVMDEFSWLTFVLTAITTIVGILMAVKGGEEIS